jgi:magnesium chelatase subunit I
MPEDVETGGIDAICPNCAKKYATGEPLAVMDRVRLVELPLNGRLEDVIGGLDERGAIHDRLRLRRGILAQADRNLLYVDEVNLLNDEVVDAILDAAAQGSYTVRRGPMSASYRSRFVLIGSMNPEEGRLRPQILDRFGLRLIVRGLADPEDRLEVYHRVHAYLQRPRETVSKYLTATEAVQQEIQNARDLLPDVDLPDEAAQFGLSIIAQVNIDSLRAEITLFEASRAHAAADGRTSVTVEDIRTVAPMTLRLRRSTFMEEYFADQEGEERQLAAVIGPTEETKEK